MLVGIAALNCAAQHTPLIVFINPRSGGQQGEKLLRKFKRILGPNQVFELSKGGPEAGYAASCPIERNIMILPKKK